MVRSELISPHQFFASALLSDRLDWLFFKEQERLICMQLWKTETTQVTQTGYSTKTEVYGDRII